MRLFRAEEYYEPNDIAAANELLNKTGRRGKIIAGGTSFYELATRGMIPEVETIVSIRNLNLDYLIDDQSGVRVGATSILDELSRHDTFRRPEHKCIADAINEIRPIQVRNVATIGGAICTALPLLDLPPALLALDSSVIVKGLECEREIPLERFFLDWFLTDLHKGEILTEVKIPRLPQRTGTAFVKIGRTRYDFCLVNVAARITFDEAKKCTDVRIYFNGVGRVPYRAFDIEKTFIGKPVDESTISKSTKSLETMKAMNSIHGSAEYKRKLAKVVLRECLTKAASRACGD